MSKALVKKIILCCVVLVAVALFSVWFLQNHILYTSDTLSSIYSRSASAFTWENFYVKDNTLYFVKHGALSGESICRVKNDWTHTISKLPSQYAYEDFVVIDDQTILVRSGHGIYRSVSISDETMLWQGESLGYDGEKYIYFVNDGTLYSATLSEREPQKIVSFDRLLGAYHDAIVYENEGRIYQLFYADPSTSQLLAEESPWPDGIRTEYVYTSNYALRIGYKTLDMYVYETGEIKRIFDADIVDEDFYGMAVMALAASENELYVSRQHTDGVYWPIDNKEINGTYKYDFVTGEWTRIDDNTFFWLAQFDENSLYGYNANDLLDPYKRIKLN